jgi:hypothetical protein
MDDEPAAVASREASYLVSGATLDGESVGPSLVPAATAHHMARISITGIGGTVRILRSAGGGWVEVAQYTDAGGRRTPDGAGSGWAAFAAS